MGGQEMPAGVSVPIVWQGRRADAFVPTLLGARDLSLSAATVAHVAAAVAEINLSAAVMPPDHEPLARLLLRAEGVASSYIEGVAAPLLEVVFAEESTGGPQVPAGWVAANLRAVAEAVESAHEAPLTVAALCSWHRTLTQGSPLPGRHVGVLRAEHGWIGGTSPLDAALVTPPPERLDDLLDDLVAYVNRSDLDAVAQAAFAHAQFEMIHPFADGNGRVGRVLVSWVLTRRLSLVTPPPVSTRIAADRDGYLAGLTLFRLGQHDAWARWFADVVRGAGQAQRDLVRDVQEVGAGWRDKLAAPRAGRALRRDAMAWRVLGLLPRHLVLTSALVAAELGGTKRAATNALRELADAGVLTEQVRSAGRTPGRPSRRYASPDLLALAGSGVSR